MVLSRFPTKTAVVSYQSFAVDFSFSHKKEEERIFLSRYFFWLRTYRDRVKSKRFYRTRFWPSERVNNACNVEKAIRGGY
jgi:hypothetical protein